MEPRLLQNHIRTLIELEETSSPVVSYFRDLQDPDSERTLRDWARVARKTLDTGQRDAFDRAMDRIEDHVPWKLDDSTRSVAVFARSGTSPLFLPLEFRVELPTRFFVESTPVIFHLVELKDTFHRYVLMICAEDSARILEVSLGSVTRDLWTERPELRRRVGREWTRRHYQNHRRARAQRFVKEKISLLERIADAGGHTHILLAGNPRTVARVRRALPKALAARLVDVVPASSRERVEDVVASTLSAFVEHEERESQSMVELLGQELRRSGLAAAGYGPCRAALETGQADRLLLASGGGSLDTRRREELIRLATKTGAHVEVVDRSDLLDELGGVGCLLRYEIRSDAASAESPAA
jgi:hypothetical protein